jgi:hypothetical protein
VKFLAVLFFVLAEIWMIYCMYKGWWEVLPLNAVAVFSTAWVVGLEFGG